MSPFIACQQMEIGTKPIPISMLTAVTNSALNAASVFPSRRILSESCQKTQTYRSLRFPTVAALVPSAGSMTLQIELRSDAGAVSPRHPVRARALRGSRPTHRKAKTIEVPSILQGPWRLADWIDGIS